MGQSQDIKIRALPRKPVKAKPTAKDVVPRWLVYVGALCFALIVGAFLLPNIKARHGFSGASGSSDLASKTPMVDSVTQHLRESLVHQQMLRSHSLLENLKARDSDFAADASVLADESSRNYGVQMDSEDTPERLFKELNDRPSVPSDSPTEDRIASRLANRKWVSEMDHADRVLFVRNFIRSAYDKGYAVDIDQNLVVVGVHRLSDVKKVNIDQIIDRLARQGL